MTIFVIIKRQTQFFCVYRKLYFLGSYDHLNLIFFFFFVKYHFFTTFSKIKTVLLSNVWDIPEKVMKFQDENIVTK